MARVEVLDDPLDRATLAAGVAALEEDEQPGSDLAGPQLAAEVEAQLEEPALGVGDAPLVLVAREPLRQIEFVESPHRHSVGLTG